MPILPSHYKAPLWIGGKHAQTILPNLLRKVVGVQYRRERITTDDGDFLDLDWSSVESDKLVIIAHGLEGNTNKHYILGMVKQFNARNWDALAWNLRGCGGELNRTFRTYNAGSFDDLRQVIKHALKKKKYKNICLIGFSLTGNVILKYLGDHKQEHPSQLKRAVVFSVPCDLYACSRNLTSGFNRFYLNLFLSTLKQKIAMKAKDFPGLFSHIDLNQIKDLIEFDSKITAPVYGYRDVMHYYTECSSKHSIGKIEIPTLIVNALNDPFLHPSCFPHEICQQSPHVFFENPVDGGHLGFIKDRINGIFWSEERAVRFLEEGC
ncbi:MAG: alpha/beta fold hydrolase [Verrucomicrobia bacterium]|nr:alpha/beta fold hydrolase [Verrucomicrobiota bacterium]